MGCNNRRVSSTLIPSTSAIEATSQLPSFADLSEYENTPTSRLDTADVLATTVNTQVIVTRHELTNYPVLKDRVEQSVLTSAEIGDFIVQQSFISTEIVDRTTSLVQATTDSTSGTSSIISTQNTDADVATYLTELEHYFDLNLGASIAAGVCAIYQSATFLFSSIESLTDSIDNLSDLSNFSKEKFRNTLNKLATKLKTAVDEMVEKYKTQIENIVNKAIDDIAQLNSNIENAFKAINKRAADVQKFFSEESVESIKDSIEKRLSTMAAQFEDIDQDKLEYIMFRACKMTDDINSYMQKPVDEIRTLADGFDVTRTTLSTKDADQSINSVVSGSWRTPVSDRKARQASAAANINANNTSTIVPNVVTNMTAEEMSIVRSITAAGSDYFTFASSVQNMGNVSTSEHNRTGIDDYWDASENYADAGWQYVQTHHPEIYVRLIRVAQRMSTSFTINSAYRSPWYNRIYLPKILGNTGAAKNSLHMQGNALDIKMTKSKQYDFIKAASQEGFTGIGVYSTFVHVDCGRRRYWANRTLSIAEKQLIIAHADNRYSLPDTETSTVLLRSPSAV